ncbi:MAG: TetR/AcrR family transcriptional regulator [Pseudomonadales bacterium]
MARPSIKEERLAQILQALQRCVAKHGIEGSTLERIAEEAGLKRSLVRHFAGNRDELVMRLADKVVLESLEQWREFLRYLPAKNCGPLLLDGLFDQSHSDPEYVLVIESLIFAAGRDAPLREKMCHWLNQFDAELRDLLRRDYPRAEEQALGCASFGIISLYFNLDSLSPLGVADHYRGSARQGAQYFLDMLASADR